MKFVAINFCVIDDTKPEEEQEGAETIVMVPLDQLAQQRVPMLSVVAEQQAQRFWETLVMMGETGL